MIEKDIMKTLPGAAGAVTADQLVELMVASQIIESNTLYKQAFDRLTSSFMLTLDQARLIGVDATYAVLAAQLKAIDTAYSPEPPKCFACSEPATVISCWACWNPY